MPYVFCLTFLLTQQEPTRKAETPATLPPCLPLCHPAYHSATLPATLPPLLPYLCHPPCFTYFELLVFFFSSYNGVTFTRVPHFNILQKCISILFSSYLCSFLSSSSFISLSRLYKRSSLYPICLIPFFSFLFLTPFHQPLSYLPLPSHSLCNFYSFLRPFLQPLPFPSSRLFLVPTPLYIFFTLCPPTRAYASSPSPYDLSLPSMFLPPAASFLFRPYVPLPNVSVPIMLRYCYLSTPYIPLCILPPLYLQRSFSSAFPHSAPHFLVYAMEEKIHGIRW